MGEGAEDVTQVGDLEGIVSAYGLGPAGLVNPRIRSRV